MEDKLKEMVDTFNRRVQEDPKLKEGVADKKRTVVMEVTDGDSFNFLLDNCTLTGPMKGNVEPADIRIMADKATFTGIFSKELSPLKAYATKKLRVKASFSDLMLLQKLLK